MIKIVLADGSSYEQLSNFIVENTGTLNLIIKDEVSTTEEIYIKFSNSSNTNSMSLYSDGELMRTPFVGYTSLDYVKLTPSYIYNSSNDTCRAFEIVLNQPTINDIIAKNTADIAYIAMESGVEI